MSKLDKNGLVPYPGIGEFRTLDIENIWLEATTTQRDALLELFELWIDEADETIKRNHYKDLGQEGIAYLYGKLADLKGVIANDLITK